MSSGCVSGEVTLVDTPTPARCLLNVILDTTDTAAFATAVGSGVPGTYVARLDGDAQEFSVPVSTNVPFFHCFHHI